MKAFYIKIRIQEENELYNSFDESGLTLSSDVVSYVFERFNEKEPGDKPVIYVISDTEIDQKRLQLAFTGLLNRAQTQLKADKRRKFVKQLWMFSIGVAFIGIGVYAANYLPVITGEIISTVGAFSLWEAANIWIVENPQNRIKRKRIEFLSDTEIVCKLKR